MIFIKNLCSAAVVVLGTLSVPTSVFANLIVNPGNEDALIAGEIPGWTEVVGTNWTQRSSDPTPYEGTNYFFAGVSALAELAQSINVSSYATDIDAGLQSFTFEGHVRSYSQSPTDTTRIVLEFLDASSTILESFDSGAFSNTSSWDLVSDTRLAPASTRAINVRLISDRKSGSNNDGYFDALSLTPNSIPLPPSLALIAVGMFGFMLRKRHAFNSSSQTHNL